MMKKIWISLYALFAFLSVLFIFQIQREAQIKSMQTELVGPQIEYKQGKILNITDNTFSVEIKDNNPQIINFETDPDYLFHDYQKDEPVILYKITDESNITYDIVDYVHLDGIILIFIIFAITAIWVAKKKGFFSIISLIISTSLFYFIFLLGLQAGYSPIIACLIFVLTISILTIPLIHGFNKKSGSSLIAINLGFLFSFLITYIFKSITRLGDRSSESLRNLSIQLPELDLGEILIVILFLGAIGALIDTAVTISSAIFESDKNKHFISLKKSFGLGMEVGKDILGSMVNTLLLAYLASSIPFFILITFDKGGSLGEILNYDFIALEITRTLIGGLSLVVLIPLTAIISSWMLMKNPAKKS